MLIRCLYPTLSLNANCSTIPDKNCLPELQTTHKHSRVSDS
uniref:Uncharacterized protein n=1 Tax=Arundo donax TaxID=35708 RepID=A0A0A9AMJ9_ARUDO